MPAPASILEIEQDKHAPFEIYSIEWIKQNRKEKFFEPHRNNHYVVLLVTAGSGMQSIDADTCEIEAGNTYFIMPGQVHIVTETEELKGTAIFFTKDFLSPGDIASYPVFQYRWINASGTPSVIKLLADSYQEIVDIAEKLQKEYDNFFLLRVEILKGYLRIFLIYLARSFENLSSPATSQNRSQEITEQFFELLENSYKTMKKVGEYASKLALTGNYLNELIKEATGFPASYHIQERVMLEAKRQALYTNHSMKEVAYSLGFDDSAHFSKYFKNNAGMNFSDFRKTEGKV